MKKILFISIFFYLSLSVYSQQQYVYSSKEDDFVSWIARSGITPYAWATVHYVGALVETYVWETRTINFWEWTYSEIPTEATVTKVVIKFKARKSYDDSFRIQFHNIGYNKNQTVNFFNECTSSNMIYDQTHYQDANKNIFFNAEFTQENGYDVWNAVKNAVESGNFFFTLGIKEGGSQIAPYWELSSYDGSGSSDDPAIDLEIHYTATNPTVTIDQKLSNGTRVGTLKKWEGSSFGNPINPGSNFVFQIGSSQTILGTQSIFSNQKYNNWNDLSDVTNHHSFTITGDLSLLQSNLLPTYSDVTIKNVLEGTSASGGVLYFYDPWLIDYPDPSFGNQLRNQGMSAPPKQRNSPFYPDYTTNYNGDVYQGIFLNQEISSGNFYNVWAGDQQINLGSPIGIRQFYFLNWTATGATLQPFGPGNQQRVVFTSSNAVVQANFKGSQLSNDANAFSNNGQRRLIQTNSGNNPSWLHHVYTSMGHVWIEHSSNGGNSWLLGNNGQPLDGSAEGKNPSIAFTSNNDYNYIGVVWQQKSGSYYVIREQIFNQSIASSDVPHPDPDVRTIYTEYSDEYSVNANPNLELSGGSAGPYLITFERKSSYSGWQPGINWLVGRITQGIGGWDGPFGFYQDHGIVSGTNASTLNASISKDPAYENSANIIGVNLIRQQGSPGAIYSHYLFLNEGCGGGCWSYYQFDDGMISYPYLNLSPSIVSLPISYYSACWIEAYDMVFYNLDNSIRYYYGSFVQSCSINRGGGSSNSGFAAWSQNPFSGWSNRSIRFDNGLPVGSSISTLSTSGKYVQVGNSATSSHSDMYVSSFYPFSSPYSFSTSSTLGPLSKGNQEFEIGRGFDISNGDATFIYRFGDLNSDGKNISFVEAPDGLDYGKIETLNNVLITEPFKIVENSRVVFSERSGFADSLAATIRLGEDGFIIYSLTLIDEATGEEIAQIKNVNLNSSNVHSVITPVYLLNTNGLAGKTVRIKISMESNLIKQSSPQLVVGDLATIPDYLKNRLNIKTSNLILTKSFKEENEAVNKTAFNNLEVINLDIPMTYALAQNYPNPFNPATTIKYQIPEDGLVVIKIYDMLGKVVKTLVNEPKAMGRYEVKFNASSLASGVYLYSIKVNDFVETKKMILLK